MSYRNALRILFLICLGLPFAGCTTTPPAKAEAEQAPTESESARSVPSARTVGELEIVATFRDRLPAGIAVSGDDRLFVAFPRWDDNNYTVAEVIGGEPKPYPSGSANDFSRDAPTRAFASVESLTGGPNIHLWVLDTGRRDFD